MTPNPMAKSQFLPHSSIYLPTLAFIYIDMRYLTSTLRDDHTKTLNVHRTTRDWPWLSHRIHGISTENTADSTRTCYKIVLHSSHRPARSSSRYHESLSFLSLLNVGFEDEGLCPSYEPEEGVKDGRLEPG